MQEINSRINLELLIAIIKNLSNDDKNNLFYISEGMKLLKEGREIIRK